MRRNRVSVSFRLPADLLERVEARVVEWRGALPGIKVTRTDIVVVLLEAGLRSPEANAPQLMVPKEGS